MHGSPWLFTYYVHLPSLTWRFETRRDWIDIIFIIASSERKSGRPVVVRKVCDFWLHLIVPLLMPPVLKLNGIVSRRNDLGHSSFREFQSYRVFREEMQRDDIFSQKKQLTPLYIFILVSFGLSVYRLIAAWDDDIQWSELFLLRVYTVSCRRYNLACHIDSAPSLWYELLHDLLLNPLHFSTGRGMWECDKLAFPSPGRQLPSMGTSIGIPIPPKPQESKPAGVRTGFPTAWKIMENLENEKCIFQTWKNHGIWFQESVGNPAEIVVNCGCWG